MWNHAQSHSQNTLKANHSSACTTGSHARSQMKAGSCIIRVNHAPQDDDDNDARGRHVGDKDYRNYYKETMKLWGLF